MFKKNKAGQKSYQMKNHKFQKLTRLKVLFFTVIRLCRLALRFIIDTHRVNLEFSYNKNVKYKSV